MGETGIVVDDFDLVQPLENNILRDESGRPYEELSGVISVDAVKSGKYAISQFQSQDRVALVVNITDNKVHNLVAMKVASARVNSRGGIVFNGPRIKGVPTKFI